MSTGNRKLTKVQWVTLGLILFYLIWEFVILASWKAETEGPLLRVDLLLMYPLIVIMVIISIWQYLKKSRKS